MKPWELEIGLLSGGFVIVDLANYQEKLKGEHPDKIKSVYFSLLRLPKKPVPVVDQTPPPAPIDPVTEESKVNAEKLEQMGFKRGRKKKEVVNERPSEE